MKTSQTLVAIVAAALLSLTAIASAHEVNTKGYVVDSRGHVLRNNFKECVRTGFWTPAMAIPECDAGLVLKPAAVAVAPAPVAVAKEEPKPVAPKEVWKTVVTQKLVTIEGTNFDTNSAKLKPEADKKLNDVVDFAMQNKEASLAITGYTDSRGSDKLNQNLSERRAESVKAYLVKKGIAADRITTQGEGAANPVADNKTSEGRAKNRRVEIKSMVKEEKKVRVTE